MIGVYVAGVNRTCAQPRLTASWVAAVSAQSWRLIPIYKGLQPSCGAKPADKKISLNLATAASQGTAAANEAVAAARSLGMLAGRPDALWLARYDLNSSLTGWPGIPSTQWATHQRAKQYRGGHNETYGGVMINIDNDNLDAPVATVALTYRITSGSGLNARTGPGTSYPVRAVYPAGGPIVPGHPQRRGQRAQRARRLVPADRPPQRGGAGLGMVPAKRSQDRDHQRLGPTAGWLVRVGLLRRDPQQDHLQRAAPALLNRLAGRATAVASRGGRCR